MKCNWRRRILGGLSLTSALFIFQACYGTPQDFGLDTLITGYVKSKSTGNPIKGIKVSIKDMSQYEYTNEYGNFSFYTEEASNYKILFQDIDSDLNGRYTSKDTIIANMSKIISLDIVLEDF